MINTEIRKKYGLVSHDKFLFMLLVPLVTLFLMLPDWFIKAVTQHPVFRWICELNPFVTRMAGYGNQNEYALFCYGISFLLTPCLFYIALNSISLKQGVVARYLKGGKGALRNSAIFSAIFFIFLFFYFGDFSSEHISRINRFIFHSHFGIATMSIGFTILLVLLMVSFIFYATEYFKRE